ncbi:Uncharacterised protein [Acholeplasma hippikon]|uniref:Uncharacterized protein n=1 Tax=Acholeplasma hippikon TaxID=264636 RepID=A0A449BJ72_9MOLU|nr:Uncharacterised protein [Acholeplasma hippikon]
MENAKEILASIWSTIVSWFQTATGWLDPIIKPTTDNWWQSAYDLFMGFPALLQVLLVGFLILLVVMGLISLIKKSMKLVVVVGLIVVIFLVLQK